MTGYAIRAEELEDRLGLLVDPRNPGAHVEVFARPEFAVPIIGSGISGGAGYPSGEALAMELIALGRANGLDERDLDLRDPRSIADVLTDRGVDRDPLLRRVGEIYGGPPTRASAAVDALLRVRSRRIVTLNYDGSLEARAADLGVECQSLVLATDGGQVLEALAADAPKDKLIVIHAHGVASDPATIVLDAGGYGTLLEAPYAEKCLWLMCNAHRDVRVSCGHGNQLALGADRSINAKHAFVDLCTNSIPAFQPSELLSRELGPREIHKWDSDFRGGGTCHRQPRAPTCVNQESGWRESEVERDSGAPTRQAGGRGPSRLRKLELSGL